MCRFENGLNFFRVGDVLVGEAEAAFDSRVPGCRFEQPDPNGSALNRWTKQTIRCVKMQCPGATDDSTETMQMVHRDRNCVNHQVRQMMRIRCGIISGERTPSLHLIPIGSSVHPTIDL